MRELKNCLLIIGFIFFGFSTVFSQDVLVFRSGQKLTCHITELDEKRVWYIEFDYEELRSIGLWWLDSIIYSNGEVVHLDVQSPISKRRIGISHSYVFHKVNETGSRYYFRAEDFEITNQGQLNSGYLHSLFYELSSKRIYGRFSLDIMHFTTRIQAAKREYSTELEILSGSGAYVVNTSEVYYTVSIDEMNTFLGGQMHFGVNLYESSHLRVSLFAGGTIYGVVHSQDDKTERIRFANLEQEYSYGSSPVVSHEVTYHDENYKDFQQTGIRSKLFGDLLFGLDTQFNVGDCFIGVEGTVRPQLFFYSEEHGATKQFLIGAGLKFGYMF